MQGGSLPNMPHLPFFFCSAQIETGVQIDQTGISLIVSIQAEPVLTVRTNVQHAGRWDSFLRETYETFKFNR